MTPVNPFVPGRGRLPPYLAGREVEQAVLLARLAGVNAGEGAPAEVVLVGPRGNGKTALLRWFEREVRKTGKSDTAWLTPNQVPTTAALLARLAPADGWERWRPDRLNIKGVEWELSPGRPDLTEALTARCRDKPLVLLLDEAHTLGSATGSELLNTSQQVCAQAPFLLVLAGTPGLRERLNTLSVTFRNRCEKLGIGRLTQVATRDALIKPLADQGLALTPAALDEVVDESQCYPYFIQLWGAALWDRARESGSATLDTAEVARVRSAVTKRQNAYYQDRFAELKSRKLLAVAGAVASAFTGRNTLSDRELDQVIAGEPVGLDPPDHVLDTCETLRNLGYIWQYPAHNDWEPGIPSLMKYVRVQAAPGMGE